MPGWIVIPNWDRFQHYRDRNPTWIKNYTELMSTDAYLQLTFHQRGVLHGLWMEYARAHRQLRDRHATDTRQLRDSTSAISRRLGQRVSRATLEALSDAGFIEFSASPPLATPEQPASPEKEKEKELPKSLIQSASKTGDNGRRSGLLLAAAQTASSGTFTDSLQLDAALDRLEAEHQQRLTSSERLALWERTFQ